MKIVDIYHIDHIKPNMTCGTGYSEPDIFRVICDNGEEDDVVIDTWYVPFENVKNIFERAILGAFGETCENIDDAFEMYKRER